MDQFNNRFAGEKSPQNSQGDQFASAPENSLPSSPHPGETPARLPLPADWFGKDPQELLQELGQLTKADLVQTLVVLLGQEFLPAKTHNDGEVVRGAETSIDASWGPEYNTRQLAQMGGVSRQAIALRVHNLVARGRLEPRCTGRWTFDEEEARLILRRKLDNGGPVKKYLS